MIKVSGLTKYYGSIPAVKNLNFTIEDGHIYGLLGPNGAGKTTTMSMLTGTLAPSEGEIVFNREDIFRFPISVKGQIGYLPENPPLYPELTPKEYLTFVARAKRVSKSDISSQVATVMEQTGLTKLQNRLIANLSKGYRQRVGIAQAMIGSPRVIILDEPTVGLDPQQVVQVRELIKKLSKKMTVILSSHILSEIEELCDRILILSKGELIACDSLENLQRQYAGSDVLTLTVSCSEQRAKEILSSMKSQYEFTVEDIKSKGCRIALVCPKGRDPRESIFFAFAKARTPIIEMNYSIITLEDVFLKATEKADGTDSLSDAPAQDTQEIAEEFISPSELSASKGKGKDKKQENEEEYDDGDDYRPLFG